MCKVCSNNVHSLALNRATKTHKKRLCLGKIKYLHIAGGVQNIYIPDFTGEMLTQLKS